MFHPCFIRGCILGLSLVVSAASVLAADPQKEILDGLRAKGDYAAAAEYLQHVRTNPGLPKAFAETIDYELAITHIDAAQHAVGEQRDAHYRLAQEALKSFLADHAGHSLAPTAQSQLGSVLLERGRLLRSQGEQREGNERETPMTAARDYLAQAATVWTTMENTAEEALKKIVFRRGEDIKRSLAREELHGRLAQARLARAWVQYEKGLTYRPRSSDRTAALQQAAGQFDAICQQQRERLAGFYARLGRGLCFKQLGEDEKAFAVFEGLFGELPDEPNDFRLLRGKAALHALETSLQPGIEKYKPGMDLAQKWIAGETAAGVPSDLDLAIRFLGAEAALGYLKSLPPPTPEQAGIRGRHIDWIRQQYLAVAAATGTYQTRAKVRLLDPALGGGPRTEADTFADARTRAKAALDRLAEAEADQKAAARSGVGNDADAQRQRQQQISAARAEALNYCRLALEKSATVAAEDRDTLRYFQAFLYYDGHQFAEAAVEGEALAASADDTPAARQAARVGLAAREALFHAAQGDFRAAALARLRLLAEKIVQRWASYSEANDARAVLLDLALGVGQLDKAEELLRQIPDSSLRRGEAELSVGRALWGHAQHLWRISTLEHDHIAEAEKLTGRAAELLRDGIVRCRGDRGASLRGDSGDLTQESGASSQFATASPQLAGASFSLAQIELSCGRAAEAIALLEGGSAKTSEASSLLLLAYVTAGELEKARVCLQAQQASIPRAEQAAGAREMIRTCLRFQRLLKEHLTRYRERRMDEVLKQTVNHCQAFLSAPVQGAAAESRFLLLWRAEAYSGLAAGLDSGGPAIPPLALPNYRRAITAFQDMLRQAAAEWTSAPAAEVLVIVRIDLAHCLRRLGDYPQALGQLLEVLKDHPRMVDAQVEAAYVYQFWGDDKPECLDMAIQGGRDQGIWGWGELARRVQAEPRFREVFFEARYNLALCRFRQTQAAAEKAERSRLAAAAENDILATRRLAPDMGGPVWYDRYHELFQRIQRLADHAAVGLPSP